MQANGETVLIVDDDAAVRDSMRMLLKTVGINAQTFGSGDDFIAAYDPNWDGCILLDIRMPGTSGMEVQNKLLELGCELPVIFVTGHGDIPMAVDAMHKGAFDFLQKPFRDQELLDRITEALAVHREHEEKSSQKKKIRARFETLTPREKEVMQYVVKGAANKVIALDLEVSQRTVEIHRSRVMEKMHVRSLAQLVRASLAIENP
jgi:two-component system response regulator FixJ